MMQSLERPDAVLIGAGIMSVTLAGYILLDRSRA
jgi:L-2-hydroxyglutarate oxidase LhgO